jgi:hypothetical protein
VFDWNHPDVFPVTKEESSVVNIKIWTNKAGTLKTKLEAGMSPAVEKDVEVTELNTWVEYSIDFSDQIGASHRKLVFFFNAGILPDPTDIYYLDDIRLSAAPSGSVLEDFEDGIDMDWSSLGDEGVFGTFNGDIPNPDVSGVNKSPNVGSYTKGTSQFGGLKATLPVGFTLEDFPQLNLQIWAPAGATSLTMKLFSPTQGLKTVTVDIAQTGVWEDLSFIFADFSSILDFERLEILFDEALVSQDTWYFDNLTQGEGTVDACAGTVPILTIFDDFDCQRNVAITNGSDRIAVVPNPFPGGINPDPLDKVAEYSDPHDAWSAIVYDNGAPIDLSTYNQLHVKIYSTAIVPILFKLEDGAAAVEVFMDVTATNAWVNYVIDFSEAPAGNKKLVLFLNAGVDHGTDDVYYIDDVLWKRAPITGCIMDFETAETTFTEWNYFGGGEGTLFEVQANPNPTGINESDNVGIFTEQTDGQVWNGMFTDLPAPIAMPVGNKTITGKFLGPHEAIIVMKMEGGIDGAPGSGDTPANYTTPGEWQELTWDFTANTPDNAQYGRLTLIPNIEFTPTEVQSWYFDDIAIADSECGTTGVFNVQVDQLGLYPNPASDFLIVEQTEGFRVFRIMNAMGQVVGVHATSGQSVIEFDLNDLVSGVYVLTAFDAQGTLKASGRFVKN